MHKSGEEVYMKFKFDFIPFLVQSEKILCYFNIQLYSYPEYKRIVKAAGRVWMGR